MKVLKSTQVIAVGVGVLAIATIALIAAWWRNDWNLDATAAVGDTVAPLVGILSLLAVGAALWSVRVQYEALDLQRRAFTEQQASLNAQLDLQRQALQQQEKELLHQREAMEAELRYRRHAALREAYAPFLSAAAEYHEAVHEYFGAMLRNNCEVDVDTRQEWQAGCDAAHAELKKTVAAIALLDTNTERGNLRWKLSSKPIRLEPWVDNHDNQKAWLDVILYRISELTEYLVSLRDSLHREFGDAVAEKSTSAREFDQKMNADLKAKAQAAEACVSTQLKQLVKEEAIRSGRIPPDALDDEDAQNER